jgi:anti-sigma factor ChrR (cupin superfamily)
VRNRLYKIAHFEDLNWMPLIKGVDLVPLNGDLNGEGSPFVLRLRWKDGAKIPPHWHPTDENITVLPGTLLVSIGETFDEAKLQAMNVGNLVSVRNEMRHFAMSKGETIVQVHGALTFTANW